MPSRAARHFAGMGFCWKNFQMTSFATKVVL
jgi:hypothetical protein